MPMSRDSVVTAVDFINLRNRVRNEMLRRNGLGSLTGYSSPNYDFSTIPSTGSPILEEHFDKIRDVMAVISPYRVGLGEKSRGDIVMAMSILEANMTSFEAQPRNATSNNDCNSQCSGMCVWTCINTCAGTCSADCRNNCSGSCSGGCRGGCGC